jgi:hypothetical protein
MLVSPWVVVGRVSGGWSKSQVSEQVSVNVQPGPGLSSRSTGRRRRCVQFEHTLSKKRVVTASPF